jgi:hypothetical protein
MKSRFFTVNFTEVPLRQMEASFGYDILEIPAYEGKGQFEPADAHKSEKADKTGIKNWGRFYCTAIKFVKRFGKNRNVV